MADTDTQKRTEILEKELQVYGLQLRADSVVCSEWINSKGEYTLEQVVDKCRMMAWLYSETNYRERLMKRVKREKNEGNHPDRKWLCERMITLVIEDYGGGTPWRK